MFFDQAPAKMPERPYEKLSPEQREIVFREFRRFQEQGCIQPKLEPSLLGLDWDSFVTRKFAEHAHQVSFLNPAEFISLAFSALDAYATAMLAAHFSCSSLGVLNFTCSLKRRDPESPMYLEFATIPEWGRIDPDSVMLELLHSFPEVLQARGFKVSPVMFMEGEGCLMEFAYPGRMVAEASPFLRNRPVDHWPQVTLCLNPTNELRIRAQDLLAFLRSSPSVEGNLN
jgi:hypothetical protein